jgi:tyrosyl-DNA phosphodiesterase 2
MSESTPSPIMQALTAALNSGPAQRLGDEFYEPRPQNYCIANNDGEWQSTPSSQPSSKAASPINPGAIRLVSWNIDVLVGHAEERMRAALICLEEMVSSTPPETPVVVFLQEMGRTDLKQIREADWIKDRFNITEFDHKNWITPHYGTTTLVDSRLSIKGVFRVPWVSKFDRDGLFVDIVVTNKQTQEADKKVLRLCNTHLESLVADPPVRPLQLATASPYLKEANVVGALLAGDLNAIQPFDRTLHSDNGLKDTYLELGGKEDSEDGYTWGYQVAQWMKDKFGCSRMDKIFFHGAVQPDSFERIGMGVKVAEEDREKVEKDIEGAWVTDHYGVMGDFKLLEGWELQMHDSDSGEQVRSKLS